MDDFEHLVAFALGELDPASTAALQARLASDSRLANQLGAIRRFLASVSMEDLDDAPPWTIARVKAAFTGHRPLSTAGPTEAVRRFIARVVFDSRDQVAVAGYRGGMEGFHLSLTSDVAEIDLRVAPSGGAGAAQRWTLLGQVEAPPGTAPAQVTATTGAGDAAAEIARTNADSDGMFRIQLAPGTYELAIRLVNAEIAVPAIKIG